MTAPLREEEPAGQETTNHRFLAQVTESGHYPRIFPFSLIIYIPSTLPHSHLPPPTLWLLWLSEKIQHTTVNKVANLKCYNIINTSSIIFWACFVFFSSNYFPFSSNSTNFSLGVPLIPYNPCISFEWSSRSKPISTSYSLAKGIWFRDRNVIQLEPMRHKKSFCGTFYNKSPTDSTGSVFHEGVEAGAATYIYIHLASRRGFWMQNLTGLKPWYLSYLKQFFKNPIKLGFCCLQQRVQTDIQT